MKKKKSGLKEPTNSLLLIEPSACIKRLGRAAPFNPDLTSLLNKYKFDSLLRKKGGKYKRERPLRGYTGRGEGGRARGSSSGWSIGFFFPSISFCVCVRSLLVFLFVSPFSVGRRGGDRVSFTTRV